MAGYNGWSMSNNAVEAYMWGERPLSKWTKADIIADVEDELPADMLAEVKKAPVKWLRMMLLRRTGWHHTSKFYNQTDFYETTTDRLEGLTAEDIAHKVAEFKYIRQLVKEDKKPVVRQVEYLTWSGSRKHPHATRHVETCEIRNGWAYTSGGRKSVNGTGFKFLD